MNLVDSCGWLEFFAGTTLARHYAPALESPKSLIVPTICLHEVSRKILRERGEEAMFQVIAAMQQGQVVDLNTHIATTAAAYGIQYKLPIADSIVFATAKRLHATVWTQDRSKQNTLNWFVP